MNAEIQTWNPVLLAYLRSTTRELKFDWNAVAENVRIFASREQYLEAISITPALCRELFASDYTQFEKVLPPTAATQPTAKSAVDIMQEYENMSYDELMEHVQVTEQNMKQRKEQIFSKVLSSLGGVTGMESSAATVMIGATLGIEYDQTRQAYSDNLAAKEAERLKKVAFAEEQAERSRLERERDVLKKRFEAGSADGVGEDPLAKSAYKYGDSANLNDAGDKTASDLDFIDSLPYDPNVTQALQNYMETDEFDVMLTELEREIDAMAPGKDAGETPSELSEILKVLEVAAASKSESAAKVQRGNRVAPQTSGLLSAPVANLQPEAALVPSKTPESVAAEKTAPAERNSKVGADYLHPPAQGAPVAVKPAPSAAPQRQDPYDRSRKSGSGRGSGGSGGGASGVETKTEGRGGDRSDSDDEGGDGAKSGNNSSDSDEDWRSMRNRQKRGGASVAAPSKASNVSANPPPAGFWGAYGKPTVASSRQAAPETVEGDSADPRYNVFVAEYAAAHNVRLTKDEETDDEGSDLEASAEKPAGDATSGSQQIPTIPEHERVEELEKENPPSPPSSPNRLDSAQVAILPSEPAFSPSASPVPPLPPVSPPKAPAPLPVSVPLSAQLPPAPVQALSGSLGAAAGRRPRGKAGSIMGAGKTRKPAEGAQDLTDEAAVSAEVPPEDVTTATAAPSSLAAQQSESAASVSRSISVAAASEVPAEVLEPLVAVAAVDLAALAAEEAARVAALRASAIYKAVSLDLLHAPVLSPLPCAYVSNKSCGTTAEFSTGSLPAKLSNCGVAVDRLVLVDVDLARLQAPDVACCGDAPWVSVVAWVLQSLGDKYGLLALQSGVLSTNGTEQRICRMVLETTSDKYSASELLEAAKSAPLASVLAGYWDPAAQCGDETAALSVADVVSIRDSYAAPLMADLEFFSAPLSDKALMSHLHFASNDLASAVGGMVSVRDVAVCALKSHVFSNQLFNAQVPGISVATVLNALVSQAEKAGLRLCGMRLVHLNALELFEYESFCSVPGYSRPVPPAAPVHSGTCAYNQHVLPVLCLAFHSSSVLACDASAPPSKTGTTSVTNTAATVLRALLGPDDPALAVKTDPKSLRAQFGESKEHNLAYPIPHSADRLLKETSFWFGGRAAVAGVSRSVSLLSVAPPQVARIGVTLKIPRSALNASSAARLNALQTAVITSISDSMGAVGQLRSLSTFTSAALYRAAIKATSSSAARQDADSSSSLLMSDADTSSGAAAQYLVWEFTSHVGDLFLDQCVASLVSRASSSVAEGSWTVAAEWTAAAIDVAAAATEDGSAVDAARTEEKLSGSKLLALDMLKRAAEDDCRSHEDVGLADVAVLSIGDASRATTDPLMPVFISVLSLLPRTCEATVLAAKTQRDGAGMLVLVRGYQILENIDYAVSEMQRVLSGKGSPGRASQQKAAATSNKAKFEFLDADHAVCYAVKVLKGKRALEAIFTEFPLSSLFVDLALRDLHTYVPLPGLQRSGVTWLEQVSHSAAQWPAQGAAASSEALVTAPAQYLQALFPPGVFTAIGAVLVPWLADGASFTRNLARIVARLEKEHFEIVEIKAVPTVSDALVRQLYVENLNEYAVNVRGNTGTAPSGVKHDTLCAAAVQAMKSRSAIAILVRRRSALLQLKSLIGPVFSTELAEAQYPRSLACLLASLSNNSSSSTTSAKASAIADAGVPLMLPTLSCAASLSVLEALFPHFYASYEAQQAAVSLNAFTSSGAHSEHGAADSANIEHLTERTVGTGIVSGQALRVPQVDRLNTAAMEASGDIELRNDSHKGGAEGDALRRQVDIAGIVVTHALLHEVGVGVILESLHREGLAIRNAYTTHLTGPAIKQLQQLAGASSLSMKPAAALLSAAPVLVLGLEGPSHSFVRFKSYSTVARSAMQLWRLSAPTGTANSTSYVGASSVSTSAVGARADTEGQCGDWGVLASSSSRLAKDLFKHCFDGIFGDDSAFVYSPNS